MNLDDISMDEIVGIEAHVLQRAHNIEVAQQSAKFRYQMAVYKNKRMMRIAEDLYDLQMEEQQVRVMEARAQGQIGFGQRLMSGLKRLTGGSEAG